MLVMTVPEPISQTPSSANGLRKVRLALGGAVTMERVSFGTNDFNCQRLLKEPAVSARQRLRPRFSRRD